MSVTGRVLAAGLLGIAMVACSTDPTAGPPPLLLTPVAGTSQQLSAGASVPILPAVRVTRGGEPVEGVSVIFTVASGGGTGGGTAVSNADGIATASGWTLGNELGEQRMVAVIDEPGGGTALFSAYAIEVPAAQLSWAPRRDPITGGRAGLAVHNNAELLLQTVTGTPISAAPVQWRVLSGDAVIEAADPRTNSQGVARLISIRFGGTVGDVVVEARVSHQNLASDVVTWRFRVEAGEAHAIIVLQGQGQSATAGTVVPTRLRLRLEDFYGNVKTSGTVPRFVVVDGGGQLSEPWATIDPPSGTWLAPEWTLGPQPGRNAIRVEVDNATIEIVATGT